MISLRSKNPNLFKINLVIIKDMTYCPNKPIHSVINLNTEWYKFMVLIIL